MIDETIPCEICSSPTSMLETKLCDSCYNAVGIFNEIETASIAIGLKMLENKTMNKRTSRHWTVEDKNNRILEIKQLSEKVKILCR